MNRTNRFALIGMSVVVVAFAACGGSTSPAYGGVPGCTAATATATNQVTMQGMAFSPACIKVAVGTTVTFTNNDATLVHTVTADDGTYNSGNLSATQQFSHAFPTAGTSHFHCIYHATMGMVGTVVVQ